MNILLVGGSSVLMNRLIRKFRKEGHRVCLLTGNRFKDDSYEKTFETYRFPYESESVRAVFESVLPDVTVFLGAYDPNFFRGDERKTAVPFMAGLTNLLTSFDISGKGRFIFLSSEEVYGGDYAEDIKEEEQVRPETDKGRVLAQGENLCAFLGKQSGRDIVTLRLQHLYEIPAKRSDCNETLTWLCLEALQGNTLHVDENRRFAVLYESDAVEFIYETAVCRSHQRELYNLSSSQEINEAELGRQIYVAMNKAPAGEAGVKAAANAATEQAGQAVFGGERKNPSRQKSLQETAATQEAAVSQETAATQQTVAAQEATAMQKTAATQKLTAADRRKGLDVYRSVPGVRCVLSNERFMTEFKAVLFGNTEKNIARIVSEMKTHKTNFLTERDQKPALWDRVKQKAGWFIRAATPFVENLICFIPFFLLNRYTADSAYFSRLDAYLLYVLLFAIVHGQHQAIFSAVLSTVGFFFQQSMDRSGFEVAVDYNTYVWIAQLFIVGLLVGYLHDRIKELKDEAADEREYLAGQLTDIRSINESNVRVKGALTAQIINQNDSIGKIYRVTSELNLLMPEEVLFRAASMLGELMQSRDVAIYTVSDSAYARLFSSTSPEARKGGNSLRYQDWEGLWEALKDHKVYINRQMDERYPMMASGIYNESELQTIVMLWSLPWDRMTLGQADYLVVCGYLIQNAVVHANRYLSSLRTERYVEGLDLLNEKSFRSLAHSFLQAKQKGLTECTLLEVDAGSRPMAEAGKDLKKSLRSSDYVGKKETGGLYVLLSNTGREDAALVMRRFEEKGYRCRVEEERGLQ